MNLNRYLVFSITIHDFSKFNLITYYNEMKVNVNRNELFNESIFVDRQS